MGNKKGAPLGDGVSQAAAEVGTQEEKETVDNFVSIHGH